MTKAAVPALICLAGVLLLGGCASTSFREPVRSNPILRLTDARVTDTQAALQLEIENPSDSRITLTGINYELIYGPLPVAEGLWSGSRRIERGETINLNLAIGFDQEPGDTTAAELELRGTLMIEDDSRRGAEGLTEAAFSVSAPARR